MTDDPHRRQASTERPGAGLPASSDEEEPSSSSAGAFCPGEADRPAQQLQPSQPAVAGEQLRRLAEAVAHSLGTSLSVIIGRSEMILSGEAIGAELDRSLGAINEKAREMKRLIDALVDYGRRRPLHRQRLDLRHVVGHVVAVVEPRARKEGVALRLAPLGEGPVEASVDADQLGRALRALLLNGIEAMPGGGTLDVSLDLSAEDVEIAITDQGAGIVEGQVERIFEPFFSTKPHGPLGLGLSIARTIVADHDGWITFESKVGLGTTVTVHLPRERER